MIQVFLLPTLRSFQEERSRTKLGKAKPAEINASGREREHRVFRFAVAVFKWR